MAASERSFMPTAISPRIVLWMVTFAVLASLLTLLTMAAMDNQTPSQDIAIMDWMARWQLPGQVNFFEVLSVLTGVQAGLIYGPAGIVILLLRRKVRAAIAFFVVGITVAAVATLGDSTLGEMVVRGRPLDDGGFSTPSFPSGHVFGSTVFFSFIGFLAVYYRVNKKVLIPSLAFVVAIIILVGPARVSDQAHFPSDVAAGYLLAALWLLVIIPAFLFVRGTGWGSSRQSR